MLDRRIFLIAALILFGLQAAAMPIHVSLTWPGGLPSSALPHVRLRAVRTATSGSTNNAVPVEAEATSNGMALNLGAGVWQVQASAPGYWSQPTEVVVSRQPADVRLSLWPAVSLHGQILTAEGGPLPRELEVRLTSSPASASEATPQTTGRRLESGPSRVELHCPIRAGTWSCIGPAGQFDVQLEAAGYAPRYEWRMSLKAAETDLGRTLLRRTASVFGRAVRQDGSNPPLPCRAILRPALERHGGPQSGAETAPAGESSFSVPLSSRGYFQIVGVLPGMHLLTVQCAAASGFREIPVQADSETRINPPLQLEELTLNIAVTPRIDPEGHPWQLTVDETAPRYVRIANKAAASADGLWVRHGLMTGNYRVTVHSSDGTWWLQRYFDLRAGSGPLSLRLASVHVAGRVTLSSLPVRARLVFSNNAGGQAVMLKSGNDGRFQGLLPVMPNIQENSTWTVEARVAQPPVTQRLLDVNVPVGQASTWLDLELPAVAVHGSVVSADGQLQRSVQVTFEDSSGIRTTTSTDDAGNFEMSDLPPGKYTAVADSPEGSSDRMPFDVVDGGGSELKLVLNPFMRVPFHVVSNNGPVANAAVQVWIKPGVPRAFARTDQDGNFQVGLPPETTEVGLTVGAPGYALKLTRFKISSENEESPDANTITLNDSGGKLVLKFNPPGRSAGPSTMLYLVHNGAIQDARTVTGWGTAQAGSSGDKPAVVEAIEPGKYALCSVEDPSQLAALWSAPPSSDRCRTGALEQDETLILSPVDQRRSVFTQLH